MRGLCNKIPNPANVEFRNRFIHVYTSYKLQSCTHIYIYTHTHHTIHLYTYIYSSALGACNVDKGVPTCSDLRTLHDQLQEFRLANTKCYCCTVGVLAVVRRWDPGVWHWWWVHPDQPVEAGSLINIYNVNTQYLHLEISSINERMYIYISGINIYIYTFKYVYTLYCCLFAYLPGAAGLHFTARVFFLWSLQLQNPENPRLKSAGVCGGYLSSQEGTKFQGGPTLLLRLFEHVRILWEKHIVRNYNSISESKIGVLDRACNGLSERKVRLF